MAQQWSTGVDSGLFSKRVPVDLCTLGAELGCLCSYHLYVARKFYSFKKVRGSYELGRCEVTVCKDA
jgi:hypothetical protein